jgi:hypothetical protein
MDQAGLFFRNTVQTQIFIHVRALTSMSTFERLSRLDLEIHEIGHQKRLTVDETSPSTERIISRKYNTYIKSRILNLCGLVLLIGI